MDTSDIPRVVDAQRRYFATHVTKDPAFRLDALRRLERAVLEREERIYEALARDFRKPRFESYSSEVGLVLAEIRYHMRHLRRWVRPRRVRPALANLPASGFIVPEPYGVTLIMAPWNYPFGLLIVPLVGAISAGNCVVLKPAHYAEHTAALIAEMVASSFEAEYIAAFTGGREVNQALLEERYDYIFFTGSASLGRLVMERASRNLTPVTLELGGKNPCIVDEDADLPVAARRIVWGKHMNAGQTCVAPDYLLAHRSIKSALVRELEHAIIGMYGPDPRRSEDYPRIATAKHLAFLRGLLQRGRVSVGGEVDEAEMYVAPTIIEEVTPEDPIMQEEIFGPILPVLEFGGIDEAIDFVNARPKPLALYYFSGSRRKQRYLLSRTSSGGVCINDTVVHFITKSMPFGGVGGSGMGAYHGKWSFLTFSHRRPVFRKPVHPDIPIRYPPYRGKLWILKALIR